MPWSGKESDVSTRAKKIPFLPSSSLSQLVSTMANEKLPQFSPEEPSTMSSTRKKRE
jgi:hypothetical protein